MSTGTVKIQSGLNPINVLQSIPAFAIRPGQVNTLLVEEGDVVSKGDVLARQDIQRLNARKRGKPHLSVQTPT